MYGDKITSKERTSKKGSAIHKAIMNKTEKSHTKNALKNAHERVEKKLGKEKKEEGKEY